MKTRRHASLAARILPALVLAAAVIAGGCEDTPPNAYTPVPFVEGYLFVDRPIEGIRIMRTQPLTERFSYASGMVADAEVTIEGNGARHALAYRVVDGIGEYALPDTTVLVAPDTRYKLHVRLPDGAVLTAETRTPERIAWIVRPKPVIQYPSDTVRLPTHDSLRIAWTPGNVPEYLVRARCLDTLGYGRYLAPATPELNGRTNNLSFFETPEVPTFYSTTRYGFLQNTEVNTVWSAFRWYGRHAIAVLAPDANMIAWFKATQFSGNAEYRPQFGSVRGGLGVFGSASIIEDDIFLLKRAR